MDALFHKPISDEEIATRARRGLYLPRAWFLVAGTGDAAQPLVAFDLALMNAGIADVNLVRLSSIVGPDAVRIDPVRLAPGILAATAYARAESQTPGERIAAAVAIARPAEPGRASVIMEYAAACPKDEAEATVRAMAEEAIANRGLTLAEVESIATDHVVQQAGAAFAGVVQI